MQAEWKDRVQHWIRTLRKDLYQPLDDLHAEGFCTFDELSVEEALKLPFQPFSEGDAWGDEYEYAWFHTRIRLPEKARGQRIVMDLPVGGESTLYVNGKSFGTYRAS